MQRGTWISCRVQALCECAVTRYLVEFHEFDISSRAFFHASRCLVSEYLSSCSPTSIKKSRRDASPVNAKNDCASSTRLHTYKFCPEANSFATRVGTSSASLFPRADTKKISLMLFWRVTLNFSSKSETNTVLSLT